MAFEIILALGLGLILVSKLVMILGKGTNTGLMGFVLTLGLILALVLILAWD